MKKDYLSTKSEPVFNDDLIEKAPAEITPNPVSGKQDQIASIRDSVLNEPSLTGSETEVHINSWIETKRSECTLAGNVSITFLVAILGGPFAIIGAIMNGQSTIFGAIYVVLFGPIIEELLKQSGMVYLLERRPYRIFSAWQFVFAAIVSALVFSAVENLLYINLYVPQEKLIDPAAFARFRWTTCTILHVSCAAIASRGMIRVWKKQLLDGKNADLSNGFRYFLIAIMIHGTYNFWALFANNQFLKQ
jgi:RsiW-degrading membrane proteinase PrsW (M82 family)